MGLSIGHLFVLISCCVAALVLWVLRGFLHLFCRLGSLHWGGTNSCLLAMAVYNNLYRLFLFHG